MDCACQKVNRRRSARGATEKPERRASCRFSNVYLNEVDTMLARAKEVTRAERWTYVEYARFADDLVVLVDGHPRQRRLRTAVERRLREELATLQVEVNEEKSRRVDLTQGESFGFLGFEFRRIRSRRDRWMPDRKSTRLNSSHLAI